jgi:hypothetical protein
MARLAGLGAPSVCPSMVGGPPPDIRQWLIDNDLYYDDFGISADQWAREPTATAYVGKRFNRVAGVWEPESLAGDAEPG